MRSLTFVFVVSVLCSATAITLPNGFTFDESQFLNLKSRATSLLDQKCEGKYSGCLDDCETTLECDGNYTVINSKPCSSFWTPYCVKGVGPNSYCTRNFPMHNPTCLNKALNSFMCTEDGNFADPTDCTKYHICKGSSHSIAECPAWHRYGSDPYSSIIGTIVNPYNEPGNGEFACHFNHEHNACYCFQGIDCDGNPNRFTFLGRDIIHYAYCFVIGSVKKVLMFKCPTGTVDNLTLNNVTNSGECLPVQPAVS